MTTRITIREIDPKDKSWLEHQARVAGVTVDEFVLRLIREKRAQYERKLQPSKIFKQYFGKEHGVELPESTRVSYKPVSFHKFKEA